MTVVRLEVPVGAVPGPLARPEAGIAAIRTRLGARRQPQLTVIDTSDLRLAGAGVLLVHRVVDGLGEWVLRTSGWDPYLQAETVEPFGHGDLPEDFSALTSPFRRLAPLGVQGHLTTESREFTAVGPAGEVLATLRDTTLTADLGSVPPAVLRVATVTQRDGSRKQVAALLSGLEAVGARRVAAAEPFVALVCERYRSEDFSFVERFTPDMTMHDMAQGAVRRRVRRIVEAELAFRRGIDSSPDALYAQLGRALRTLDGLAWASRLDTDMVRSDLEWVLERPGAAPFSERYLSVIDGLLAFARQPRLGEWDTRPAAAALTQEIDTTLLSLINRARRLDRHAPQQRWEKTRASAVHAFRIARVSRQYFGSRARGLRRRLDMIVAELDACLPDTPPTPSTDGLAPAEAFEAGRAYERAVIGSEAARVEFVANWRDHQRYFKQLGIKP
ncbi:hypothetical protein [Propionicicella superfundia]|uniref:hypothetical protein n=1 Tax=Propionicicella superfundia TaxID=348582 RepID=UPI0004086621|nr:hypothetical protein [Propionicicella superfundia]